VKADGAHAVLTWQIKPGQQVRVGPVFTRGNFVTKENTILLWVPMRTGSVLTTTAAERGQRNLALIQLFNNASPVSFPAESASDPEVPMVIEVEERHDHYGVVRVGGGASTEQRPPTGQFPIGVYASAGYEHRNLLGRGWTFLSQGNYGNSLARAAASFTDPRFLGTLFRLELAGSYLRQATVRLGDIRSGSGSIGFAREMFPGVDAALRYNLSDTFRTEFLLRGAGPDEEQTTVQIGTVVGSVAFTIDWLRLDNPLVPTRGFKISGAVEAALPALSLRYGEDTFVKVSGRSLVVVPLLPWLSLRHSVRYDQGLPFSAPVLPKVERYFAGGDTTIRGFELDRARSELIRSPLSVGIDAVQYRPVGGSLRLLHNVDLQFPIIRPWYGAIFLDSGVVADSFLGLEPARFRHGVGISPLLIRLPIGDLSLSWAWPLDPQAGDARFGRLHFNVGLMF
jgi:outer membrane protein insertion porin family